MNLLDILKENSEIILTEAVRINSGKEAYELIKNNRIGTKIDPSYKFNDDDTDKSDTIIISMDKLIRNVGANNAPFAVQLAVSKVPLSLLPNAVTKLIPNLVKYKNRPWAKQVPGYSDIINLNSHDKINVNKWISITDNLETEEQNHGHKNKNEVEEAYNDGTWIMYIPHTWKGAKSVSFFGKDGEVPKPTHWCTRADKQHYDMYSKISPLYIIRNLETGKAYQISFDKNNVYFLDQNDEKGDEITKGDLTSIPSSLLKKIKWNGRTLADYKKESERTTMNKGELKNPTADFKEAEWESPKDEGDGIVSQVMKNLHNKENEDNIKTFMINGKPFKFNKRNNYAKKYYYKNKPNYIVVSVLSQNGDIRNDIFWPFKVSNDYWEFLGYDAFSRLVGDRGFLLNKAAKEKVTADNKRDSRRSARDNIKKDDAFNERMINLLASHLKNEWIKEGLAKDHNEVYITGTTRTKKVYTNEKESFGNFMPVAIEVDIVSKGYDGNYFKVADLRFDIDNMKAKLDNSGSRFTDTVKDRFENSTNRALKSFAKEAIKDQYGKIKRSDYREKSKGIVTYDSNNSRRLQFEDYFPY